MFLTDVRLKFSSLIYNLIDFSLYLGLNETVRLEILDIVVMHCINWNFVAIW